MEAYQSKMMLTNLVLLLEIWDLKMIKLVKANIARV